MNRADYQTAVEQLESIRDCLRLSNSALRKRLKLLRDMKVQHPDMAKLEATLVKGEADEAEMTTEVNAGKLNLETME